MVCNHLSSWGKLIESQTHPINANCILLDLLPQLVLLHQLSSLEWAQTERQLRIVPRAVVASGLRTMPLDVSALRGEGFLEWKQGGCWAKLTRGSYTSWLGSCCACHLNKTESFLLPKDQVRFLSFCETELLTPSKG